MFTHLREFHDFVKGIHKNLMMITSAAERREQESLIKQHFTGNKETWSMNADTSKKAP